MIFGDIVFFFFKQKTAYEIRKGDWSSDVCSSDLAGAAHGCNENEAGAPHCWANNLLKTRRPASSVACRPSDPAQSGRPDSNRRRPAWEAGILPLNYARKSSSNN